MIYLKKAEEKEVKKREKEQITIRLPVELKEKLQQEAAEFGMSFNGYLLWLIDKARQNLPQ